MSRNGRRYLVTGASGFVGRKICASLLNDGASLVRLFDIVTHPFSQWRDTELASQFIEAEKSNKAELFQGDLRDSKRVSEACKGIDVVYHVASFGMSGKEMLQKKKIYEVNVQGVQNLLDACVENDVEMIIYTSTYNVVFAGQKLSNEVNPPYAPLSMHVDEYSRTKTIAERDLQRGF